MLLFLAFITLESALKNYKCPGFCLELPEIPDQRLTDWKKCPNSRTFTEERTPDKCLPQAPHPHPEVIARLLLFWRTFGDQSLQLDRILQYAWKLFSLCTYTNKRRIETNHNMAANYSQTLVTCPEENVCFSGHWWGPLVKFWGFKIASVAHACTASLQQITGWEKSCRVQI